MYTPENLMSICYNNIEYDDFKRFRKIYEWSKSFYNNKELDRRSGLPYMSHIEDILCLAVNKYEIYDIKLLNIINGHDIYEENDYLYQRTNKDKGYSRESLELKLLEIGFNKFEIKGIEYLTHDEDISKLEKTSKVIDSNKLKFILVKTLDIMANSSDHPENLKFTSKLNKIQQADLMISYLKNYDINKLKEKHKYITEKNFKEIIFDLQIARKNLFDLTLDEKIILDYEEQDIYQN